MLPVINDILKIYLFYLIDYDLVSYNGQKQIFSIKDNGYDLLDMIEIEKNEEKSNIEDIVITIE
jgi:hypothetical protein